MDLAVKSGPRYLLSFIIVRFVSGGGSRNGEYLTVHFELYQNYFDNYATTNELKTLRDLVDINI